MYLRKIICNDANTMELTQNHVQICALILAVINLWFNYQTAS